MRKELLGVFALLLGFLGKTQAQVPPPNDNYADRLALAGSFLTTPGTLVGATFESIETNSTPPFSGGPQTGGSVWWTWTAPQSSAVVIQLVRDYSVPLPGDTEFDVYSGTDLNALTLVAENSFDKPSARYVAFMASAGTSYQFRMAGPMTQAFSLKLTATNAPVFVVQPQDTTVSPHGSALFYARAAVFSETSYQWKFNGVPITNQTFPSLVVYTATTNADGSYYTATTNAAGSYSVTVSNAVGVAESAPAMLTVTDTPRLAAMLPVGDAQLSFSLTGEAGRWYQAESSTNLVNWGSTVPIYLTNSTQLFSVPRLGPVQFVRASFDTSADACVAQLEQMRWALDLYRSENRLPPTAPYALPSLFPYMPQLPESGGVACPAGGYYSVGPTVVDPVTCSLPGHVLDAYWTAGF